MTAHEPRVCAVFLFNHKFERNLPLLDRLYASRFSRRHVIMPFASQPGPGISRVYELGRNFSGHIAQAARDFIAPDISHYVFLGDDLILNPRLNEANLIAELGLVAGESYIKNLVAADALRRTWPWAGEAAGTFRRFAKALDLRSELPPAEQARGKFEALGIDFAKREAAGPWQRHVGLAQRSVWAYLYGLSLRGQEADYPLLAGYSDFVVVPAQVIERFVHYCGVFAALNLFAEIAIPTALALAAPAVRTELQLNTHFDRPDRRRDDAGLRGIELWSPEDSALHGDLLGGDLDSLLARFPRDWLYLHPVKLSAYA